MKSPLFAFGALSFAYFAAIGLFNPYSPLWLQSLGFSTLAIGGIASLHLGRASSCPMPGAGWVTTAASARCCCA